LWLAEDLLVEAISVAYQASLTAEEARPTRFRLLLTPPETLPLEGRPNEGALRLVFSETRPFNPEELRSLGPSAPFEASLIGASEREGQLRIWGLAHSGPAWLAPNWGGRSLVPNWTFDPIIHVTGPGHIVVRCAGRLIGGLERGHLINATMDVFESSWLPELFLRERQDVQRAHAAAQARSASPTVADQSLVGRIGQHMLRRAIQLVRGARHGGMILIPDTEAETIPSSVNLKYRFEAAEPARRYRTLLFSILDRLAAGTTSPSVDWTDFQRDTDPVLEKLEQAVFEMSRVMAGLAAIDGAVLIDKRFALLGFGGEVSGEIPNPPQVWRANDIEAHEREPAAFEDVGTRHRAAYRFVHHHPGGLAIVISQDGNVSFVANRSGDVVFWEQTVGP